MKFVVGRKENKREKKILGEEREFILGEEVRQDNDP